MNSPAEHKFRDGILAIVYRKFNGESEFLAMHRVKNWTGWEFPKGGTKRGESHHQALIRELKEECGIRESEIVSIHPTGNDFRIDYPKSLWEKAGFNGALYKIFNVELKHSVKVTITKNDEPEHDEFRWIKSSEAANYLDKKLSELLNGMDD